MALDVESVEDGSVSGEKSRRAQNWCKSAQAANHRMEAGRHADPLSFDIRLVFPSGNEKTRPEAASAQLSIGVKSGSPLAIARRYAGRSPMRCR